MLIMGGWHSLIQVYNNKKKGGATVMRCYFPGHTFDGTSCKTLTSYECHTPTSCYHIEHDISVINYLYVLVYLI